MKYLVTGGCGFIGGALIVQLLKNPMNQVLNLDALTYAANPQQLGFLESDSRYSFVHANICDSEALSSALEAFTPDIVINLAAETHVDSSISHSKAFIDSNIKGVHSLLESCREYWGGLQHKAKANFRFYQISTDEVFGDTSDQKDPCGEDAPYQPGSPYAASKAAADHLVRAWHRTYGLPTIISASTNNYGPHQHEEKLIPKVIKKALNKEAIPIYGDGQQSRDWLHVEDHAVAIEMLANKSAPGESWNIAGGNVLTNLDLVKSICEILDELVPLKRKDKRSYLDLIEFVKDRPGHDRAYKINAEKIRKEMAWQPSVEFQSGLRRVVESYLF